MTIMKLRIPSLPAHLVIVGLLMAAGGCSSVQHRSHEGTLVAVVYGERSESVAGASISLFNAHSSKLVLERRTDPRGRATFQEIDFAAYRMVARAPGYLRQEANVDVRSSGQLLHVRLRSIAAVEEEIAALIEAGELDRAEHTLASTAAETAVLAFLDVVWTFHAARYLDALGKLDALQQRFPELASLTELRSRIVARLEEELLRGDRHSLSDRPEPIGRRLQ